MKDFLKSRSLSFLITALITMYFVARVVKDFH